ERRQPIRILVIGDVVGRPGRTILADKLADFVEQHGIGFVVANGENTASGSGIIPKHVKLLLESGIDVITTGDHIWKQKKIVDLLKAGEQPVLRPANYPADAVGTGARLFAARDGTPVGVVNLIGRVYVPAPTDCPFRAANRAIEALSKETRLILVDFHAEATSEKIAMGWHLNGRATAVFGTHTHVPTADERVLPGGTAYVTDLGMTGPYRSVIGRQIDPVLFHFRTGMYARFDVASGDVRLCGAIIEANPDTGKAQSIERVCLRGGEG
ncbi:MAG: TIGR00282 family metallophosphoesterase, partial [Planctomycetota bacterium]